MASSFRFHIRRLSCRRFFRDRHARLSHLDENSGSEHKLHSVCDAFKQSAPICAQHPLIFTGRTSASHDVALFS